jgi:quinol monooxygenase YgiN
MSEETKQPDCPAIAPSAEADMTCQVPIHATVTILAREGQREQLVHGLVALAWPTRAKPGCVRCDLYANVESPDTLTYVEEWATWPQFERHLRSEEYRRLLIVMELAAEPPDVRYRIVSHSQGMEAIHAARVG